MYEDGLGFFLSEKSCREEGLSFIHDQVILDDGIGNKALADGFLCGQKCTDLKQEEDDQNRGFGWAEGLKDIRNVSCEHGSLKDAVKEF